MSKRERATADILEDLLIRLVRIEDQGCRIENKVDVVRRAQTNMETAVYELSRDVKVLRARLVEEAGVRAGLGQAVLAHEVQLSLIRGQNG